MQNGAGLRQAVIGAAILVAATIIAWFIKDNDPFAAGALAFAGALVLVVYVWADILATSKAKS